jgi:sugar phosphate isomerase/epimerase
MKIGYGSYGMPDVPIWDALPRLAEIGYEAVEICAADRWPTAPGKLAAGDRVRLRSLFRELGLELPAVMLFLNLLEPAPDALERQEALFREACALARDLSPQADDRGPVIVSTLGHCALEWDEALALLVQRAVRFGGLAEAEGCRLALEPHVGSLLDRPERVVWLMERVHLPSLAINFDISHFAAAGCPRSETIRTLAPYAIHTHVKDARMVDGKVQFLLPGVSEFDYAAYFREMAEAGWTGCITVEVSAQIFNRPDYDPWVAARFSYEAMRRARQAGLDGSH